jgi:hypothetical protein
MVLLTHWLPERAKLCFAGSQSRQTDIDELDIEIIFEEREFWHLGAGHDKGPAGGWAIGGWGFPL